ncbi:S9 family peptidase [Chitinophaga costaii]|nr:S9 family peptidase [Chitinophaga costaii]
MALFAQKADYAAANKYEADSLATRIGTLLVIPQFINHSDAFWFSDGGIPHKNTFLVDPKRQQQYLLFDKQKIVPQLAALRKEPVDSIRLPDTQQQLPKLGTSPDVVQFDYKGDIYLYNYVRGKLSKATATPRAAQRVWAPGSISPDKQWTIYEDGNKIVLKSLHDTATPNRVLANNETALSFTERYWHNATTFCLVREDTRKVGVLSVINSLAWPRPRVETYKYELPGDKNVKQFALFIGHVADAKLVQVNIEKWQDQEITVIPSDARSPEIFFTRSRRTRDEMELCAVDIQNGKVRVVINEVSKPYINTDLFAVKIWNGGNDILWWSDRSGWGHYYLYAKDGTMKNAVTHGEWTAARILQLDTLHRTLLYYGYGKEKGRNPNFPHVYESPLSGGAAKLITPEDASHQVFISPTGQYIVDTYSRIDQAPQTVLRTSHGKWVKAVFTPDISKLYAYGWKTPEPFTVKAKDGITNLYGIMWKPYNFDSTRKYPVISQVYPGPQTETVWTDFTVLDRYNNTSLAQLGCIVVCMGHRGGSPYRNAAYYKYGYGQLRDYALEDDKYGLEQLAQRYSFIDIHRVGITGHSGGGAMAATALCTYPDFYKVGVASSGNHDNSIYNRTWGESYQGISLGADSAADEVTANKNAVATPFTFKVDKNQSLAKNLKGKLLLVAGEYDMNVNPSNTLRMADALIHAGKDFELLILPGQTHTYEGDYKTYYQRKQWHFFGRYLIDGEGLGENTDLMKQ